MFHLLKSDSKNIFTRLIAAWFISSIGDWLYKLALPLLVLKMTGSAVDMAGAFALTFLPFLIFSLAGGVIADRFQRRRVLILCDLGAFALLMLLALAGGWFASMPLVYILVFLVASITPIHHPSFQAFIPETVDHDDLPKANALVSGSDNIIAIAAPILSGLIVALIGPTQTIILNALSFLVSALLVSSIPFKARGKIDAARWKIADSVREGFTYAWSHPVLKYGSLLFVGSNFAVNVFQANLIFYLTDILGASPQIIGFVFTEIGIGALIGSIVAPWFIKRFESGRIIVISTILAGLFAFPLLWVHDPLMVGAVWALETVFGTINPVTYFTLRQRSVPKDVLGRAVAVTRLVSFSSIPLASLIGGLLLERTNIAVIILVCACVRLATGLLAMCSPLMRYRSPKPVSDGEAVEIG
ncbi:MAG: MFS transporter [Hyphomicrobiales bacterium]